MKTVLMGLAGLGMLVIGAAGANASPLATGTNLATPDTGASSIVEQARYSYHQRHYRSHRNYHRYHRHHRHHHRHWR